MKNAILFGASGFIGSYLLADLLASSNYAQVTVVVRRELPVSHPKLKMLTGDYSTLRQLEPELAADDIFIALGTTRNNTPDQRKYYEVDHDYPVLAAKLAKEHGAKSVFIVSSVGADAGSSTFYIRTKGETERDILALNMERTAIFRPSMLMGERKEKRVLEKIFIAVFSVLNPLLVGGLKKFRGIQGAEVARAMVLAAGVQTEKAKVYQWDEMQELLKS